MLFTANSQHCTNCRDENPATDEEGYTLCCNDSVCDVNAEGRCMRCNPLCHICGWEMTDGYEVNKRGDHVHPDNTCPKGESPKVKRVKKTAERKLAENAGIVPKAPSMAAASGSHANCDHEPTKSARAKCRRERAGK